MDYSHDKAQAAKFLNTVDPTAEKFLFVEIGADGGTRQNYTNLDGVWPAIERTNIEGGSNWFVTINQTTGSTRKAADVSRVRALFIDLDNERASIAFIEWCRGAGAQAKPTMILKTSEGKLHAYWLVEGCPPDQFKLLQQSLITKFNSDPSICDLPRVMRLAGTYNVKGEPQLCKPWIAQEPKRWRVDELGLALGLHWSRESDQVSFVGKLRLNVAEVSGNAALSAGVVSGWWDNLSGNDKNSVLRAACAALASGTKVFEIESDGGSNPDWLRLMCALARSGAPEAENIFVEYALKAKTPDTEAELRGQFNRDDVQAAGSVSIGTVLKWAVDAGCDFSEWKAVAATRELKARGRLPAKITEPLKAGAYTRTEAVILLSERMFFDVATGEINHIEKAGNATPRPYANMTRLYANILVKSESEGANKPAFPIWTAAAIRPTRDIIFDPQKPSGLGGLTNEPFNTWQGFNLIHEPDPTKTRNTHELIFKVICNGNREHYEYILNCLAWLRQKTGKPLGIVLNLIGTGGMGKTVFGELLVTKFFGAHGQVLNSREQLGSRFNGRMEGKIITFVEETIFQGDKGLTDQFKASVTGTTLSIERKGMEARDVPNSNSFIMATNHDHAFHSDAGMSRRVFPLRVSADSQGLGHLGPAAAKDMEAGGREAFWDEMAVRDISAFLPSRFPENAEIMRQVRMSQGPVEDFLLALANAGEIKSVMGGNKSLPCTITPSDLHKAYQSHHGGQVYGISQSKLGALVELKMDIKLQRPWKKDGTRERVYNIPDSRSIIAKIDPISLRDEEDAERMGDGKQEAVVVHIGSGMKRLGSDNSISTTPKL